MKFVVRRVTVMKADAGMADLDVTATSPSGQEIPLQVTPLNDGAEMIEFSPSVPGTYMINVTYGNYLFWRKKFLFLTRENKLVFFEILYLSANARRRMFRAWKSDGMHRRCSRTSACER